MRIGELEMRLVKRARLEVENVRPQKSLRAFKRHCAASDRVKSLRLDLKQEGDEKNCKKLQAA